jgi:hypothetical protein
VLAQQRKPLASSVLAARYADTGALRAVDGTSLLLHVMTNCSDDNRRALLVSAVWPRALWSTPTCDSWAVPHRRTVLKSSQAPTWIQDAHSEGVYGQARRWACTVAWSTRAALSNTEVSGGPGTG